MLAEGLVGLARVDRSHVGDVEQDAEPLELGVERVAGQLDHLKRLLDPLQREVLGLAAEQGLVGRDERVHGQQAESRRAVDHHDVVVLADLGDRLAQGQLPPDPAGQGDLGLGQAQVGRDHRVVNRLGGGAAPGEHVTDRRVGLGVDVEVVGEVALRVEVDRQDAQAGHAEGLHDVAYRGGLSGSALLAEDRDRERHRRESKPAALLRGVPGPGASRRPRARSGGCGGPPGCGRRS